MVHGTLGGKHGSACIVLKEVANVIFVTTPYGGLGLILNIFDPTTGSVTV